MPKLYSLLFLTALISSCSKDPNTNNNNNNNNRADGTLEYKVNGSLVTINNVSIAAGEYATFAKQLPDGFIIPHTRYMFKGVKGLNNNWVFAIQSDSLTMGNFTYDSTYYGVSNAATVMTYNGQESALLFAGDYISINITSCANGCISGDFTAKFSPLEVNYSKRGTTLITEGLFKNIPCSY